MRAMTWLTALVVVALIAVFAALTGIKPKGTRHVARTNLMTVARVALFLVGLVIAYLMFRSRTVG